MAARTHARTHARTQTLNEGIRDIDYSCFPKVFITILLDQKEKREMRTKRCSFERARVRVCGCICVSCRSLALFGSEERRDQRKRVIIKNLHLSYISSQDKSRISCVRSVVCADPAGLHVSVGIASLHARLRCTPQQQLRIAGPMMPASR